MSADPAVKTRWPATASMASTAPVSVVTRAIRALYSAETITVYQAYSPGIAYPALPRDRFPTATAAGG